jgi:hypothetical protein
MAPKLPDPPPPCPLCGARTYYDGNQKRRNETQPWGPPDEVTRRIIELADAAGASTVLVSLSRGVMPHERFMHQVQRFGREVLPALQANEVNEVPLE